MSLSCDNLLCDALGRSPSAKIVISLKNHQKGHCWIKYCQTEVAEVSKVGSEQKKTRVLALLQIHFGALQKKKDTDVAPCYDTVTK